jgi:hypothetical protein
MHCRHWILPSEYVWLSIVLCVACYSPSFSCAGYVLFRVLQSLF